MARRDRSYSPDTSNKRVRPSHRSSPRSPSPTRRSTQRSANRSRYDDDRERDWDRPRDRDRDRHHDDRYREDRRRDSYRDSGRDDRRDSDRRRSRSRERRAAQPPTPPRNGTDTAQATLPEDDKLKAKRAKLDAWKKEREAKKALDEAKAKAMALAGKSVPGES